MRKALSPQETAIALKIRYCGEFKVGEDFAHMFNDDDGCGGSFAILDKDFTLPKTAVRVLEMRETFKKAEECLI